MSHTPGDKPAPEESAAASAASSEPAEIAAVSAEKESRSTARAFGLVTIAIFCSRILGLVREVLLNALFAGKDQRKWLDCFVVAFRTPNMLRDLFAEGALSTAFVTVFTKKIKTEGDEAAWELGAEDAHPGRGLHVRRRRDRRAAGAVDHPAAGPRMEDRDAGEGGLRHPARADHVSLHPAGVAGARW